MTGYKIIEDYIEDECLRNQFFAFTPKVFRGLDFTEWFKRGCWSDNFIPYSIITDDKLVSNVSVSKMKIFLDGKLINGIQLGTVATLPEYRKQGLARVLMEYVLDKYKDSTDLFFLFANESVVDFYPRFGFERRTEVIFKSISKIPKPAYNARKLNIDDEQDLSLIKQLIKNRGPLTKLFGALDYDFITLWHIIRNYPTKLFYLHDEKILFIVSQDKEVLHIWDIIYDKPFDLNGIIPKILSNHKIESIQYYFSPDQLNYHFDEIIPEDDSPFFIKGDFLRKNTHFKFPVTAQT